MGRCKRKRKTQLQPLVLKVRSVVSSEPNKSVREACSKVAKEEGVNPASLRSAFRRWASTSDEDLKASGHHRLTLIQRSAFEGVVLAFARNMTPLTLIQAVPIIQTFLSSIKTKAALMIIKRYLAEPECQLRKAKGKLLAKKRRQQGTYSSIETWVEAIENGQRYPVYAEVNTDEMIIQPKNEVGKVIVERARDKANSMGTMYRALGSYVPFIDATGKVIVCFYIHKFKLVGGEVVVDLPEEVDTKILRGSWPRYHLCTETGYVTKEAWANIMDVFQKEWTKLHPGVHCRVWMDNLASHLNTDVVIKAHLAGIHCWFLPKNTTHFTQPLDNLVFAAFKRVLESLVARRRLANAIWNLEECQHLMADVWEAEKEALTPRVIRKAFQKTGLVPFNREKILETAKSNLSVKLHSSTSSSDITLNSSLQAAKVAAANASLEVLHQNQPTPATPARRARVTLNQVYSSHEVFVLQKKHQAEVEETRIAKLEAAKAKAEAEEARRKQRQADRENREKEKHEEEDRKKKRLEALKRKREERLHKLQVNKCRICNISWRTNLPGWLGCEVCSEYWTCRRCNEEGRRPGIRKLKTHEKNCRK